MGKRYDPARATRERLLMLERREKAREEARAVADGVAESVALDRARGEAFDKPTVTRKGAAETGYRRLSGLEWLHSKKRITDDQWAAGERYGAVYRRARGSESIRSILDRDVTTADAHTLAELLAHAEGTAQAKAKLNMYRSQLAKHPGLIAACDRICGEEHTPRAATANGQDASALEAVLLVALDMLTPHLVPVHERFSPDVAKSA